MLPDGKVLRAIEVQDGSVIVWGLDENGNKIEEEVSVIDGFFAVSPAYWLEIRDTLKECAEFQEYEDEVKKLNN